MNFIFIFSLLINTYLLYYSTIECHKHYNHTKVFCENDIISIDNNTDNGGHLINIRGITTTKKLSTKKISAKNKTSDSFYSARKLKLSKFYTKLNDTIYKYKSVEKDINTSEIFQTIKKYMGNGFYFIVFDCSRPSYFDLNNKKVELKSNILADLKKTDKCGENSNNLWYFDDVPLLTTFDYKNKEISSHVLPFAELFSIFRKLSICDDFLKIMKHPAFIMKTRAAFRQAHLA